MCVCMSRVHVCEIDHVCSCRRRRLRVYEGTPGGGEGGGHGGAVAGRIGGRILIKSRIVARRREEMC